VTPSVVGRVEIQFFTQYGYRFALEAKPNGPREVV